MDFGRRGEFLPRCDRGHPFTEKVVSGEHSVLGLRPKTCNSCGHEMLQGNKRHSCKPCGVHLCGPCYGSKCKALLPGVVVGASGAVATRVAYSSSGAASAPLAAGGSPPRNTPSVLGHAAEGRAPHGLARASSNPPAGERRPLGGHVAPPAAAVRPPSAAVGAAVGAAATATGGYRGGVAGGHVSREDGRQVAPSPGVVAAWSDVPRHWTRASGDNDWYALPVDHATAAPLAGLLRVTQPEQLGIGRDASLYGRKYVKLRIQCAWRIQHHFLWRMYAARRDMLARDMQKLSEKGIQRPEVREKTRATAAKLPNSPYTNHLESDFVSLAGEAMLLTGVKPDAVLGIIQEGLSERLASMCGAFGAGIYMAEDSEKADQYATPDPCRDHPGLEDLHKQLYPPGGYRHPGEDTFYCFVVRAALGTPLLTADGHKNLHNPSEPVYASSDRRELANIPGCSPPLRYNSLVVETGQAVKRFREFVVFENSQCYTEYLCAYTRV